MEARQDEQVESDPTDIVYFFVPLGEPIALPDQSGLEFLEPPSTEDWLAAAEAGDCYHWSDSLVKRFISLRFWQTTARDSTMLGSIPAFDVATRAFPGISQTEREHTTTMPVTVVEAAVQLLSYDGDSPSVEVTSEAFDAALLCIRAVQRAYSIIKRTSVTLVTRERLPPIIPMACRLRVIPDSATQWPEDIDAFLPNMNVHSYVREEPLGEEEFDRLSKLIEQLKPGVPFSRYPDYRREAITARTRNGDYTVSVVLVALAAEVMLDDLLLHLLWEERNRPEDAATLFMNKRSITGRVKAEYQSRLGGRWDFKQRGPIRDWFLKIARLRNQVVHAAYEPNAEEAAEADDALLLLENYVKNRLTKGEQLKRYPRTALVVLGREALTESGLLSQRLERLMTDPNEPNWSETFARWRAVVAQCREDPEFRVEPQVSRAVTVAVANASGDLSWWLHDREAHMVCPARPPTLSATLERSLEGVSERVRTEAMERQSIVLVGTKCEPVKPVAWLHQYRALPLAGVMVDRSDFD